jgi:hypothetical protein
MYRRDGEVKVFLVAQLGAVVEILSRSKQSPWGKMFPEINLVIRSRPSFLLRHSSIIQPNSSLHVCFRQYSEKTFSAHSPMYFLSSSPRSKDSSCFTTCRVKSMSKISKARHLRENFCSSITCCSGHCSVME